MLEASSHGRIESEIRLGRKIGGEGNKPWRVLATSLKMPWKVSQKGYDGIQLCILQCRGQISIEERSQKEAATILLRAETCSNMWKGRGSSKIGERWPPGRCGQGRSQGSG